MDGRTGRGRGGGRQLEHLEFFDDEVLPAPWPQRLQSSRASRNYRILPESETWHSRLPARIVASSDDTAQISAQEKTAFMRAALRRSAQENAFPPAALYSSSEQPISARSGKFDIAPRSAPPSQAEFYRSQFDKIVNAMAESSPPTSVSIRGARREEPASTDSAPQQPGHNVDRFLLPYYSYPVGQSPPPSWLKEPQWQADTHTPKSATPKASPKTKKAPGRKRKGDLSPIPEEIQNNDRSAVKVSLPQPLTKKRKTGKARKSSHEQSFVPKPDTSEDEDELVPVANRTRSGRKRKMSDSDRAFVPALDDYADDDLALPPRPAPMEKINHDDESIREEIAITRHTPELARKRKTRATSKKSKSGEAPFVSASNEDEDVDQLGVLHRSKHGRQKTEIRKYKMEAKCTMSKAYEASVITISDEDDRSSEASVITISDMSEDDSSELDGAEDESADESPSSTSSASSDSASGNNKAIVLIRSLDQPPPVRNWPSTTTLSIEAAPSKLTQAKAIASKKDGNKDDNIVQATASCPKISKSLAQPRPVRNRRPTTAASTTAAPSKPTKGSKGKAKTSAPKAKTTATPKAKTQGKSKAKTAAPKAKTQKPAMEKKAKVSKPAPPPPAGTRRSGRLRDKGVYGL